MHREIPSKFWILLLFTLFALPGYAQEFFNKPSIFTRFDLALEGRLRQLTLEDVFPAPGKEIVVLERSGSYPGWQIALSIWGLDSKKRRFQKHFKIQLPQNTVFYRFIKNPEKETSDLLLVLPESTQLWSFARKKWSISSRLKISQGFGVSQPGHAAPLPISVGKENAREFIVPQREGLLRLRVENKKLLRVGTYPILPRGYFRSSTETLPFELPFWVRGSFWYPRIVFGTIGESVLLSPWMDEVDVIPLSNPKAKNRIHFHELSEQERDDAQSYVVTVPQDLNGDGQTDFLVNKFQGQATSLQAKTTIYLTDPKGRVPAKGIELKARGNRAAGAVPIDINQDGKQDLGVASSQFNVWAVVRALIKKRVKIWFSFYLYHPEGYHLKKPDFEREISFRFSLIDLDIEGFFPNLDGDFNGDGYPDALYARDRKQLTVLLQDPKKKERFPAVPSGTYDVSVPRQFRIGDLNGDKRTDVVLYERRSQGNRKVIVLLNSGIL